MFRFVYTSRPFIFTNAWRYDVAFRSLGRCPLAECEFLIYDGSN